MLYREYVSLSKSIYFTRLNMSSGELVQITKDRKLLAA